MKILLVSCLSLVMLSATAADFFDPMRPPAYALSKYRAEQYKDKKPDIKSKTGQKQKPAWVLSSILYSKQRQHAIINNQLVRQGDVIKGAKLIRLKPDSVRLRAQGKTIDLSLRQKIKSLKKSPVEKKL